MFGYWDQKVVDKVQNVYNLTPKNIKKVRVLDWERLKTETWYNRAMTKPCWCKLIGCEKSGKFNDESEFWIGFYEDGRVDCRFSSFGGMCNYVFQEFYRLEDIENKYDFWVQVNTLKWLNLMIETGVLSKPV